MNKLLVSDIINIANDVYYFNEDADTLNIVCEGIVTLYLDNIKASIIKIDLKDYSELNLYKFNNNNHSQDLVVTINQSNNSKLKLVSSGVFNIKNKLVINNFIIGDNNESNIVVNSVSNKFETNIIINVNIKENTKNNIALEDLKGLTCGGQVHIEPNIICSSNDVVANHLTTIGDVNEDMINYLLSKGISINKARNLLLKGFIFGNLDDYFINLYGGEEYE